MRLEPGVPVPRRADFNDFNSIKVRLERRCAIQLPSQYCYFNSIKVRLELHPILNQLANLDNFNSIKVRLELVMMRMINLINEFQFHKGAIRTGGQ